MGDRDFTGDFGNPVSGIYCEGVPILHLHKEDWRPSGHLLKIQLAVGIPMALQYSITAIGTMMVQSALNILGSYAVAAFTAGNKIENILPSICCNRNNNGNI